MKLKGVCITFKKVSKWADWTNRRTNGWMYIGKGEGGNGKYATLNKEGEMGEIPLLPENRPRNPREGISTACY